MRNTLWPGKGMGFHAKRGTERADKGPGKTYGYKNAEKVENVGRGA